MAAAGPLPAAFPMSPTELNQNAGILSNDGSLPSRLLSAEFSPVNIIPPAQGLGTPENVTDELTFNVGMASFIRLVLNPNSRIEQYTGSKLIWPDPNYVCGDSDGTQMKHWNHKPSCMRYTFAIENYHAQGRLTRPNLRRLIKRHHAERDVECGHGNTRSWCIIRNKVEALREWISVALRRADKTSAHVKTD